MTMNTRALALGAALALTCQPGSAAAQVADVKQQVADYRAMIDAENSKSSLCRGYEGKPVVPTTFDTLAGRLMGPAPKGEYETTAQFQARLKVSGSKPAGIVVVSVPLDREYVQFDADNGAFLVLARAFPFGQYSEAAQAEVMATLAMMNAKDKLGTGPRLAIGLTSTERTTSTSTARNVFGATIRTAEVNRHTRALSLSGDALFGFVKDPQSPVTGFDAASSKAPALKAGLRAALAIEPEAPYVITGNLPGAAATNLKPVHYTERTTIITARPRCALLLDAQSRVLASVDTSGTVGGK